MGRTRCASDVHWDGDFETSRVSSVWVASMLARASGLYSSIGLPFTIDANVLAEHRDRGWYCLSFEFQANPPYYIWLGNVDTCLMRSVFVDRDHGNSNSKKGKVLIIDDGSANIYVNCHLVRVIQYEKNAALL